MSTPFDPATDNPEFFTAAWMRMREMCGQQRLPLPGMEKLPNQEYHDAITELAGPMETRLKRGKKRK